ncbi:DUF6265 family protein [Altererythrobacter sp. MF3-039]|uniref:DUF6265 family protein n=1 Tax=Altererythrobacter sp. MF3-039 TaxID=3252901 RepID=UPI00390C71CB
MKALLGLVAAMVLASSPAAAQETRVAPQDHVPPPADIAQLGWLVGQWAGEGIQGAPAFESWLPPTGGTMVGTFVQTVNGEDGEGGLMFTEHMYIMPDGDASLALKLKHFNADLTGWEEKDGMLTFPLVAMEECAAFFNGLTLRCDEREDGTDGLVAAVRMKSSKPEPQELTFRFARVESKD